MGHKTCDQTVSLASGQSVAYIMCVQPGCEALETKYIANALHVCRCTAACSRLTPPSSPPSHADTQATFRCVHVVCLRLMNLLQSCCRTNTFACNNRLATKRIRTFCCGLNIRKAKRHPSFYPQASSKEHDPPEHNAKQQTNNQPSHVPNKLQ